MKKTTGLLLVLLGCCYSLGCRRFNQVPVTDSASHLSTSSVIAQGQILPAQGIIQLFSPPGDPVSALYVGVGDRVRSGDLLAVMRSGAAQAAQLDSLRQQLEQAEYSQQAAIEAAQQRLAAAQLKLAQLSVQQAAVERQQELLDLGLAQVQASREVLTRLERIASRAETAGFVGKLDVERQRIEVREAELAYRQQEIGREQAVEELGFAQKFAQSEVQAAQTQLKIAQASSAVRVVELQLVAAEVQSQASELVAPCDGTVLAIHVVEGEAAVQSPVLEMANLSQLVCEVEINEVDAGKVQPGQAATLRSRAWNRELRGSVSRKFSLVGKPQLRTLDPLAPADYRTVTATIELDAEAVEFAREWLQLQVEVRIDTSSTSPPSP